MANIEQELLAFKNAKKGEDVRDSMISAIRKINTVNEEGVEEIEEKSEQMVEIVDSQIQIDEEPTQYTKLKLETTGQDIEVLTTEELNEALEDTDIQAEIEGIRIPASGFEPQTPYTSSGQAVRGQVTALNEKIEGVEDDVDSLSAEVVNARTGYDETIYNSLGEAIRTQVGDLKNALNKIREGGGVNLFDVETFSAENNIPLNNGTLIEKASVFDPKKLMESGFKQNTAYTVSFYGRNTGSNVSGNGLGIRIKYTDSSNITTYLPNSSTTPTKFVLSSDRTKSIDYIQFYYNSAGANVWELSEIQIEEGSVATEYANYYSAIDTVARKSIAESDANIDTLETITLQATERRIDSTNVYQSFNDLPVNKIVNLFSSIKLADGPQGYVPIGHNNLDDGYYNATVLTYSAESNPRAIVQVCIFYVSGGYDYDKRPRTATRYGTKTNDTIVWSEWSTMSSSMVLHSSDKVVDVNTYSTVTFGDFNDAEPNAIFQVDLNVGNTIANNPSPGNSGLLMTFSFSPVSHHALVQNFYALENSGIEMYFRYGYKQSSPTLTWTPWKKVSATVI